jgi:hypothetical protein
MEEDGPDIEEEGPEGLAADSETGAVGVDPCACALPATKSIVQRNVANNTQRRLVIAA